MSGDIKEIASLFITEYKNFTGKSFGTSELVLHKLLYLLQRQSYALINKPFFDSDFEGWMYGPVIPELRFCFDVNAVNENEDVSTLTNEQKYIIDSVIAEYRELSSSELIELTHQDEAWKKSRIGLDKGEPGNNIINKNDIRLDASHVDFYDPIYDMYLSEMEDIDE